MPCYSGTRHLTPDPRHLLLRVMKTINLPPPRKTWPAFSMRPATTISSSSWATVANSFSLPWTTSTRKSPKAAIIPGSWPYSKPAGPRLLPSRSRRRNAGWSLKTGDCIRQCHLTPNGRQPGLLPPPRRHETSKVNAASHTTLENELLKNVRDLNIFAVPSCLESDGNRSPDHYASPEPTKCGWQAAKVTTWKQHETADICGQHINAHATYHRTNNDYHRMLQEFPINGIQDRIPAVHPRSSRITHAPDLGNEVHFRYSDSLGCNSHTSIFLARYGEQGGKSTNVSRSLRRLSFPPGIVSPL